MLSSERLRSVLQGLGLAEVQTSVEGAAGHLVANVVSPDFIGKDEAERQEQVWKHLLESLDDAERSDIEFVFTSTPEEYAELTRPTS